MKPPRTQPSASSFRNAHQLGAFSLIELVVIVGIIALLAGVLIPALAQTRRKAMRIHCVSRMKQIGLSFRLWSGDHANRYPMATPASEGGTLEFSNQVWRTFQVLSNELATPFILACPTDNRTPAAGFATLANSNISYFIGIDADESKPQMLLSGDRHLSINRPAVNKVLSIYTNDTVRWVGTVHQGGGNVVLADGSAQQWNSAKLHEAVTNTLAIYGADRTHAPLRFALPD